MSEGVCVWVCVGGGCVCEGVFMCNMYVVIYFVWDGLSVIRIGKDRIKFPYSKCFTGANGTFGAN